MDELEDFVVSMIKHNLTNMTLKISQLHLITKMTQGFNQDVKYLITLNTEATPHKRIVPNQETDTKISHNIQKRYMSGIGSKLQLAKHSRPELSNMVRELSKYMDKAKMNLYKALLHSIKYVINMKVHCYQIKLDIDLNGPWELHG